MSRFTYPLSPTDRYIVVMEGVGHVAENLTMYNAARECAVQGSGSYVIRAWGRHAIVAYYSPEVRNVHRTNNATPTESEAIAAVPFHVANVTAA